MRARNLKPSIFKHELLATSDPLYTWVFEGLWCMADREGRLEDRPRRIHLEINAGRAFDGTEESLNWLSENGFIVRYKHGEGQYIQVVNFRKHQNPHIKEPASVLPEYSTGTVQAPDKHHTSTVPARLIPDSGFPLPDSPSRGKSARATATRIPDDFELTQERRAVAEAERLPADRTFAKFCDYWRAASGAKARKHDWDATWRNWCRSDADRGGSVAGGQPSKDAQERDALRKLAERRPAIGLADFRGPNPGETADQYRKAQDAEWSARKSRPSSGLIAQVGTALKVMQ